MCPLPVEGEAIEFNDDEQAAIDSSLQEFYENEIEATNNKIYEWSMDGRYMQLLSEIRKHNNSNSEADEEKHLIHARLRAETALLNEWEVVLSWRHEANTASLQSSSQETHHHQEIPVSDT